MDASGDKPNVLRSNKIIGRPPKVKPLTDLEIQHLYVDLKLNHRRLAGRLRERGITVSDNYVRLLMCRERKGLRPYGQLVLKALAEELGVDVEQLKPEAKGGEADALPTVPVEKRSRRPRQKRSS